MGVSDNNPKEWIVLACLSVYEVHLRTKLMMALTLDYHTAIHKK